MKKVIISGLILLAAVNIKTNAQCYLQKFGNTVIQVTNRTSLGGTKCQITVNISFDMEYNDGAKYVYITTYLAEDYDALAVSAPLAFECGNVNTPAKDMPTASRLGTAVDQVGKSFLDIGFDLSTPRPAVGATAPVTMLTNYVPDPTVVLYQNSNPLGAGYTPGLSVTRTNLGGSVGRFVITGLKIIVNKACGSPIAAKTDVFATNSASGTKAQCYSCAMIQYFNDPSVSGLKYCTVPNRQYDVGLSTIDPIVKTVHVYTYLDVNGNMQLDGGDILADSIKNIQISAPGGATPDGYYSGLISLPAPYSNTQPYAEYDYMVLVTGPTLSNSILRAYPKAACIIPLSVDFTSFSAVRNNFAVNLKWQTAAEYNNKGFVIERNINGNWEEVSFVPTQAQNGNSNQQLTYSYVDMNNTKSLSTYRIKQLDIDNRVKYSELRSVAGLSQQRKIIIYPNPANNGQVNVLFENGGTEKNITLSDMSGKIIMQWSGFKGNSLLLTKLIPGIYTLNTVESGNGIQSVNKIIVLGN